MHVKWHNAKDDPLDYDFYWTRFENEPELEEVSVSFFSEQGWEIHPVSDCGRPVKYWAELIIPCNSPDKYT